MKVEKEMKPCPFCGCQASIDIRDAEGNLRDEEYERDPWSGLSYTISHSYKEIDGCPIASHPDEQVGVYLYESCEEAVEAWNKRV